MIDFACKRFSLPEVIKCSLGITKAEMRIFSFFIDGDDTYSTSQRVADATSLDLSTVQKAVKKLHEKGVLVRSQENLDSGGYQFTYRRANKSVIRKIINDTVCAWARTVEKELERW